MDKLAAMATFAHVVQAGSFTRAAALLEPPKARVSQRVSDLERHLGVRLLQRTTRTLKLTEDGQAYFEKCQQILLDVEALEGALKGGTAAPGGRLRVDALVSIARWVIAPRLHEFQRRYPGIVLRLGSSDRISHLLEDGIDCAIRGGELADSSLVARHLCDVRLGLYAEPAYLASVGAGLRHPRDLAALQRLSWFSGRHRDAFAWQLFSGGDTFDVAPTEGAQFDDPDVAMEACMAGGGICPGAPFAVEPAVRAGRLVPVLPAWAFAPRAIHIVYPSSRHLSARVRCFADWLQDITGPASAVRMTPLALDQSRAPPFSSSFTIAA